MDNEKELKDKPMKGTLQQWVLALTPDGAMAVGRVYGHPEFEAGGIMRTSEIMRTLPFDGDEETRRIETKNSIYVLDGRGEIRLYGVHPKVADAIDGLLKSINEGIAPTLN